MAEEFEAAVEDGLRLSKRIYFGKDRAVAPPKPHTAMDRANGFSYIPNSPMLYAVISDPSIVDNPDMPSYQPHVHGRCHPPALLPLQMNRVSLHADCYLDTAFVTLAATWRVHCVMGNRRCDCRIALPMGEQGSILGVEVELPRRSYNTELKSVNDQKGTEHVTKTEGGGFLKVHVFTLTIPQVDGGTNISVKLKWSQRLTYHDDQYNLRIPFSFPEYVTPASKKTSKREKIELKVNAVPGTEVLYKTSSHPLKEQRRQEGTLGFLYDSEVLSWSSCDFMFTNSVSSSHTVGSVLLTPPLFGDVDCRDMFYCYLFPGKQMNLKVFRKEVVFVVDISESMRGQPLEETKSAIIAALENLDPKDMFNVIAFNAVAHLFSSNLEAATAKNTKNVIQWVDSNFVASGGTNILLPLNEAIKMLSDDPNSIPIIFLITDGAVEDERNICDTVRNQLRNYKNICPRICTLGIGKFCNHHFLRTLALTSRGHYQGAADVESVAARLEGLFVKASAILLANIAFQNLDKLDDFEVFPPQIPDLLSESPLIVSGRYHGTFPQTLKINGQLADRSNFTLDLKVEEAVEIPIGKMAAKHQIDILTAHAWFSENHELEKKIAEMSAQNSIVSEYTNMVLVETQKRNTHADSNITKKASRKVDRREKEDAPPQVISIVHNMGLGFGNVSATTENVPSGNGGGEAPDGTDDFAKAGCDFCGRCWRHCCCMCCIQVCSRMNDQCVLAFTQLCGALACLGCTMCCGGDDR